MLSSSRRAAWIVLTRPFNHHQSLNHRRSLVWHGGYEDGKACAAIEAEIRAKEKKLAAESEGELLVRRQLLVEQVKALREEYEQRAGEPLDD